MRPSLKVAAAAATSVSALVLSATPAFAHVSVSASDAKQGAYTTLTVKVPNESDTASTTSVKLQLPVEHPLASVSIQPKSGWTYTVKKVTPSTPLSTDDGPVTSVISEVDWAADKGNGIGPGEFDTFVLSVGPLPEVDALTFKTLQTYSDGKVSSWIETPAPGSTVEPEHPAATLSLAAPNAGNEPAPAAKASTKAKSNNALAVTALALSAVALALTLGGNVRARNRK